MALNKLQLILFICILPSLLKGQQSYYDKAYKSINPDSAIEYLNKYIANAKVKRDTSKIVDGTCLLARKLMAKSAGSRAEKRIDECLNYPFVKRNKIYKGKLYLEKGALYRSEGLYAESLENYHKAKNIFESTGEMVLLVRCQVNLAEYYRRLNKYDLARNYIEEALKIYENKKLTDTIILISIYNRAAAIDNESSTDPMASIRNSRKALFLAVKSKNLDAQATSLNELGYTYKNLRRFDSSEYFYKRAEDIWFSIGAISQALHVMNNRAMLYGHNNYNLDKVPQLYRQIIQIVKEKKVDYSLTDAYGYFYAIALQKGDSATAFKYFYLYHESLIVEIRNRNDVQITNMTERYENEKAKKEVKRVKNQLSDSKAENARIYIFLTIFIVLFGLIAFLLMRINASNKKLKERNNEKDTLIQEIHHRVKNNLQFISSLVNMQMNSSSSEIEVHTLNDASRRIKAMALVHEMLYNQKETTGISIKQYLEELISSLNDVVNSDKIPIKFNMQIADVDFNVSDCIALGMITSELVSNSMKHAFKSIENPEISISLVLKGKEAVFVVKDNGQGIGNLAESKKNLGMRLIDIFSRQIKGKYSINDENGCKYEIKFTLN